MDHNCQIPEVTNTNYTQTNGPEKMQLTAAVFCGEVITAKINSVVDASSMSSDKTTQAVGSKLVCWNCSGSENQIYLYRSANRAVPDESAAYSDLLGGTK